VWLANGSKDFSASIVDSFICAEIPNVNIDPLKGGPGVSGRVLPPVTGRSQVRVAVSSHYTCEGKACH